MDAAGLLHRGAGVEDIAFRIAPLINAAGRVGHANDAVNLLCAPSFTEAQKAAKVLEGHNEARRKVERQLQDEVQQMTSGDVGSAVVLGQDNWHPGVLGIVAARIAELTAKPVLLLAFNGDIGRGSGRCTNGVNLRDALGECSDLLEAHGGHAAAAGLEIKRENFEAFRERFAEVCERLAPKEHPYRVDGMATFAELEPQTIRRLEALGPFGNGHPRPRFVTHDCKIIGNPFVESRGKHLRIRVAKGSEIMPARVVRGAAYFEELRQNKGPWSIAYTPRISSRGEDGPVHIDIHDLAPGSSNPDNRRKSR